MIASAGTVAAGVLVALGQITPYPGVITTHQQITPAGVQTVLQGRVYGVSFGATPTEIWVLTPNQILRLDWSANRVLDRISLGGNPGLQGIQYDPVSGRALVTLARSAVPGESDTKPKIRLLAVSGGQAQVVADGIGRHLAGAIASNGSIALVPLVYDNKLSAVDLETGSVEEIPTWGIAPFGVAMDRAATTAYATLWGGRLPVVGDLTARSGTDSVVVDSRGIAATGMVARIDLASRKVLRAIAVGLHPTAILWDEDRSRLYVAETNSDSVAVIDTRDDTVIQRIQLQPFERPAAGIAPTALAISPDGATLYVACGGINAIAVVDTDRGTLRGLIPTAWYPNALAMSPNGETLAAAALLGAGSGWSGNPRRRYVHAYQGVVSVVAVPTPEDLASFTRAVAENNQMVVSQGPETAASEQDLTHRAVPRRAGDPSLIEHVVFIIKENRTYDQILGDLEKGNGDPSLVMFGWNITPNHHRLADQFVLLDNFYANGGNSADGHQWLTQANETAYCLWPGYTGRSYPFDGTDPIAYSGGGFIWDAALRMGRTVRVYGEYAGSTGGQNRIDLLNRWRAGEDFTGRWRITAPLAPLNKILARNYPAYSTAIPDVVRAQIFLADLRRWVEEGGMPNLVIVQLPSDHTEGTKPGTSTPEAMVADNDLALGQIVEALTHSPFWSRMAIFVVEDDAQDGVDHVDGHRTVALVISPYARRGYVDSTFYSQVSILKTIELMLGLPSLSLFDLIASDMRASFQDEPDYTPYEAATPAQSLFDVSPPLSALRGPARQAALASIRMRFDTPDAAPTQRLNRILWHQVRGWKTPYPGVKRSVFAPLAVDIEDEDRDVIR